MKILTTISAVVFFMILTTGLATAKTPVPTFPFTATGVTSALLYTGAELGPYSTDITVNEASNGLFFGTINWGGNPIVFSAAKDSSGVYNLNGLLSGTYTVTGTFTITYVKHKGFKGFQVPIQWGFPGYGESVAGTLSQ